MIEPGPIRYARSGEVNIAWSATGDGPFDLLFAPGFVSHLELAWELPMWSDFYRRLASFSRFITFDKRGTGLSDRPAGVPTFEDRTDDIRAVLDAAGSERAAIVGLSEGGPLAILFAASYPQRARALVLWGSAPRFRQGDGWAWGGTDEQARHLVERTEQRWGTGKGLRPFIAGLESEAMQRMAARFERMAASPGAASALLAQNYLIDVRHALPTVNVPALVIHRRGDPLVAIDAARWTAAQMPNARIVEQDGDFHVHSDPVVEESTFRHIEEFLTGTSVDHDINRVLATVMFTDIVGSTTTAAAVGDREWHRLLDHHDRIVRSQLARFRGREIKATGDGFLATFDGPARAIRCAVAVTRGAADAGIEVRAALHTGECEERHDDVAGIAVHIGARVLDRAGAGQVLVSQTVKDLVVGSGIEFTECGTHELKGVPGAWQLHEVVSA